MLTEKMQGMKAAIDLLITEFFPSDFLDSIFTDETTREDIILQIMVECCKYAYDNTSEKHPVDFYIKRDLESQDLTVNFEYERDALRMEISRALDYVNKKKKIWYKLDNSSKEELEQYLIKDMSDPKDKYKGHAFTYFQYWELLNVNRMSIVKDFINKSLSKKNYDTDKFKTRLKEYDSLIAESCKHISSDDIDEALLSFMKVFTLEWKYSINYYYRFVSEIENQHINVTDETIKRTTLFTANLILFPDICWLRPDIFGNSMYAQNRSIIIRNCFIRNSIKSEKQELHSIKNHYMNITSIIAFLTQRPNLLEYFNKKTTKEDWISVFREYNIESAIVKDKIWTTKRIRYMKEINRLCCFDYKNPENRS